MDYNDYYANTEDHGYNDGYSWDGNNYGVDHCGGFNYGNYHGDHTMGHGFGQARYNPFCYGPGPIPPVPPEPAEAQELYTEGPSFEKKYVNRSNFLLRCGLPRHVVAGLPKEFLDLIDYDNCGICKQQFSSLKMGRLHYISKKHLRHQKYWLEEIAELGSRRTEEVTSQFGNIPLKSRELYCELCDVHITSKSQADLHYAGKIHRAVVLGRKRPKNLVLLQTDMKDRLDQLIRREKKSLTIIEEEDKGYQISKPEVHCEICKISVTNPEQMTMHLNGKKHLAKEKQHILSIMKAGKPVKEGISKSAEPEVKENNEDNDGWGYGGGNWDDDPQ